MDAETRKRMETRAECEDRLALIDTEYVDDHRNLAADIRAALSEIDRLTRAIAEHRSTHKEMGVYPWAWDKTLWSAIGEPKP